MSFVSPAPRPVQVSDWLRRQLISVAPAALTLVVACVAMAIGLRGVDQAAQTYRVDQFRLHGLMLWDSGWYDGNFPLGYSVLFPPVAALFGLQVTAVASAVIATWSFDRLIRTYLGSRPLGTWYFAVSTLLPVTIGQWPFLAGEASGLLAVVALQRGRRPAAIALAAAAALFSPLAAAFLALACLAWAAHSSRRRWMLATAAASLVVILALGVIFPGDGPFPFAWTGLVPTELLCLLAVTPLVQTTPAVRLGALLYAAASLFSFLVPNPLGGNAPRLAESVGVPLLACFLTAPGPALVRLSSSPLVTRVAGGRRLVLPDRWRYAAVVLVVPFAVWQWAPWQLILSTPSSSNFDQSSFYHPLVAEMKALSTTSVRMEIPGTLEHWEAAYVAPYFPLARGWERQLDIGDNPIFYTDRPLTPSSYLAWLNANGVSYVALPAAPLDYAAKTEGALLASGDLPGLKQVWSNHDWKLWQVTTSPGLVSGPAKLTSLEPDHLTLSATAPGRIIVRVHYTKFWSVSSGKACVGAAPPVPVPDSSQVPGASSTYQWTSIEALSPGPIGLSASVLHPAPLPACSSR